MTAEPGNRRFDAAMIAARRLISTLLGAYVLAWIGVGFNWVLGLEQGEAIAVGVIATVLGGLIGWYGSAHVKPWTAKELRDGLMGWGLILAIVALLIPAALIFG